MQEKEKNNTDEWVKPGFDRKPLKDALASVGTSSSGDGVTGYS